MPTLRDVRRRILSVKNTQKLTRAMKMVASSKLRRAERFLVQARPYSKKMMEVVASLAFRTGVKDNPLLRPGGSGKVELVVLTGDKGLCGGFNSNVLRFAVSSIKGGHVDKEVELFPVGKKGRDFFKRRPEYSVCDEYVNFWRTFSLSDATHVAQKITAAFVERSYQAVYLVYNEFKTALVQRVVLEQLLPITQTQVSEAEATPGAQTTDSKDSEEPEAVRTDYLYEPSAAALLNDLLRQHIEFQIYRALLESQASEQGARMTAMEAATDNADDMIRVLTLQYHRARQASITKELIEIVSGAEALAG